VRALIVKNKVRFARAEQLWLPKRFDPTTGSGGAL